MQRSSRVAMLGHHCRDLIAEITAKSVIYEKESDFGNGLIHCTSIYSYKYQKTIEFTEQLPVF